MFTSMSATGRSTRGYWGVECDSKEVVFLKDFWCADVPGVETEGCILEELHKAKVTHIPDLVCHGHVQDIGKTIYLVSVKFEVSPCTKEVPFKKHKQTNSQVRAG